MNNHETHEDTKGYFVNLVFFVVLHSNRSASIGSNCDARRAG
jgi:hypothetical protein